LARLAAFKEKQTMYCPLCRTQNENDAETCQNPECAFDFSSPSAQPDTAPFLSKLLDVDQWLPNVVLGIWSIVVLAIIFLGYLSWNNFVPSIPWVLAVGEQDDKSQLYALNWKNGKQILLSESIGSSSPDIQLSMPDRLAAYIQQRCFSGRWDGGSAFLLPDLEKTVYVGKRDSRWEVSLADLNTLSADVLAATVDTEPFISIAPLNNLMAISVPASGETMANLQVFSLVDGTKISQPVTEALSTRGILSPDGAYLLYTVTLTRTDISTDTKDVYSTTLYVSDINGQNRKSIHSFDHDREVANNYDYAFTYDNRSVVYQTLEKRLYLTDTEGQGTTEIFTPDEDIASINWEIAPSSDYVAILARDQQNKTGLRLVSLETDQSISLAGSVQVPAFVFLSDEQILYFPTVDDQRIYDMSTQKVISVSVSNPNLFFAKDLGLVAFMTHEGDGVNLGLFNTSRRDFVQNLNLNALSEDVSGTIEVIDLDMIHLVFRGGKSLFLKDIFSSQPPVLIADNGPEYLSAYLTPDLRYLLYTSDAHSATTNIYRIDLSSQESVLLVENARLLP
jgi:hypothetical protein